MVLGQTGHTGDIDVVISRNTFVVNDHLTSGQPPGNFIFNFPQGGVSLNPSGGTFDAIVSHNTFDEVMHAEGGLGQLTLGLNGGVAQVHVHDNTFIRPWDMALWIQADGTGSGTEVLVEDSLTEGIVGDEFGQPAAGAGGYGTPTVNYDLTKAPEGARGWRAGHERNFVVIDTALGA